VRVAHIFLDLALDLDARRLTGRCRLHLAVIAEAVGSLQIDAVEMAITAVEVDGETVAFDHDGRVLTVVLPGVRPAGAALTLEIAYRVESPRRGIYFTGPDADYPDKPVQVWTQGEDEDARFWFPCFDEPGQLATSEVRVRVARPFRVIANGHLVAVEEAEGERTFHWKLDQPHPSYLIALVAAELSEIADGWEEIATPYYVAPGREDEARRTLGRTPEMVAFFSERFGVRYPFGRYAQACVQDFIFGGMENTATTILTDRCLLSERAATEVTWPEDLVAHELVHQWFGDLVVIRHWSHAWIKEGAATYGEILWREHIRGADDADYYRYQTAAAYLDEDRERYRRPIVTNVYTEAIELYDRHLYEKGAMVYHMIRHTLGDAGFFRSLADFLGTHAHGTVETVDLLRAIEQATGRNLLPLFEQYVFKAGHPEFKVSCAWDTEGSLMKVIVEQTQTVDEKTVLFDLKVTLAFGFADGAPQILPLRVHERSQTFCFPFAARPLYFSFDPGNHLLKTLTLEVPVELLRNQLRHDPDLMGRIFAAQTLAKQLTPAIATDLKTVLIDETVFWGLRAEVAKALGSTRLPYAFAALREAAGSASVQVRKAVAAALGDDRSEESFACLVSLVDDPSDLVAAEAARALGRTKQPAVRAHLARLLEERDSWNEMVRAAAVAALAQLRDDKEAIDLILARTRRGVVPALRLAAIRALGPAGEGGDNRAILDALDQLAGETQFSTRMAVVAALSALKAPQALPILGRIAEEDPDGRVRRAAREATEKTREAVAQDREIRSLREAVETLQQENRDLKSRLALLEARFPSTQSVDID
jgi:aminopeptidase N